MNLAASKPQYILFSSSDRVQGTWRFSICSPTGTPILEVSDREPEAQGDRLDLLPVVLGLEALEQPSKITLWTPSRYVQEGLRFGLAEWRANGWLWEFFGEMTPVKNRDLWQRIERAMRFHQVECRFLRIDPPHRIPPGKNLTPPQGMPIAPQTPQNLLGFSGGSRAGDWVPPSPSFPPRQMNPSTPRKEEVAEPDAEPATPQEGISKKNVPVPLSANSPLRSIDIYSGERIPDQEPQEPSSKVSPGCRGEEEIPIFFVGLFPGFSYSLLGAFWRPGSGVFFPFGKRLWSLLQGWIGKLRPMLGNVFPL